EISRQPFVFRKLELAATDQKDLVRRLWVHSGLRAPDVSGLGPGLLRPVGDRLVWTADVVASPLVGASLWRRSRSSLRDRDGRRDHAKADHEDQRDEYQNEKPAHSSLPQRCGRRSVQHLALPSQGDQQGRPYAQ